MAAGARTAAPPPTHPPTPLSRPFPPTSCAARVTAPMEDTMVVPSMRAAMVHTLRAASWAPDASSGRHVASAGAARASPGFSRPRRTREATKRVADTIWEAVVARAAPPTPMPRPNMRTPSPARFTALATKATARGVRVSLNPRKEPVATNLASRAGAPRARMRR